MRQRLVAMAALALVATGAWAMPEGWTDDFDAAKAREKALVKMPASERAAAVESAMKKHWTDDPGAAMAQAAKEGKCVLMYFYTCSEGSEEFGTRVLTLEERILTDEKFVEAAKKEYVLVAIEVPHEKTKLPKEIRMRNKRIARTFGAENWLPILKILDSDGIEIATTTSLFGYRGGTKEFLKYLANKRAAARAFDELEDSIRGLKKRSPERIAKIDEFFGKISAEEAVDNYKYQDIAKELLAKDKDGKFAAKYPYLVRKKK